jgi:hypothetical protein
MIEKAAVCWDMDTSEAFLVGTKENLRSFAQEILSLLDQDLNQGELCGVKVESPKLEGTLTESGLDIVLEGLTIVKNENDTIKIINELRSLNGMLPLGTQGAHH